MTAILRTWLRIDAKLTAMIAHDERLRNLPSVDALANSIRGEDLSYIERVQIARLSIDHARSEILAGGDPEADQIADHLARSVTRGRSRKVINATGVILHTNLGRAPLSTAATEAARVASGGYTNNELDLGTGDRGSRGDYTKHLLRLLTGAEDALVVNNNAAAVLLALTALAHGKSVPVARGELVEIGGSYRLPEVMAASGARLVEVGTTNKTRTGDFETALQIHDCGIVLKVHKANYEITGFTQEVEIGDLAGTARNRSVPVVYDVGSGLIDATTPWLKERPRWLDGEPGVRQAIDEGADLVTFSGDKLLGGPQAGIIVGKTSLVQQLRIHPLRRALRVDTSTDAALSATLQAYARNAAQEIPFWRMATMSAELLGERVVRLANATSATVETGYSMIGAGSAPSARLASPIARISGRQDVFLPLLEIGTPVLGRRDRGDLVLDLRSVDPADDSLLIDEIRQCL